jgi:hypothetical protein
VHDFGTDPPFPGISPQDSLLKARDGYLYGVTLSGGIEECGVRMETDSIPAASTDPRPAGPVGPFGIRILAHLQGGSRRPGEASRPGRKVKAVRENAA